MVGFYSVTYTYAGNIGMASALILLAIVLDGLDGRLARREKKPSQFGVELDSLSDIVSFGVAPAFLVYIHWFGGVDPLGLLLCSILVVCGITRLARFNVTGPQDHFEGLPIPVAAGFLALASMLGRPTESLAIFFVVMLAVLMVAWSLEYPSLKTKDTGEIRVLLVVCLLTGVTTLYISENLFSFLFGVILGYISFAPLIRCVSTAKRGE